MTFRYISTEHCEWNEFDDWHACTETCGGGTQSRTRTVKIEAENGGEDCTGDAIETQDCNTDSCSGKLL